MRLEDPNGRVPDRMRYHLPHDVDIVTSVTFLKSGDGGRSFRAASTMPERLIDRPQFAVNLSASPASCLADSNAPSVDHRVPAT